MLNLLALLVLPAFILFLALTHRRKQVCGGDEPANKRASRCIPPSAPPSFRHSFLRSFLCSLPLLFCHPCKCVPSFSYSSLCLSIFDSSLCSSSSCSFSICSSSHCSFSFTFSSFVSPSVCHQSVLHPSVHPPSSCSSSSFLVIHPSIPPPFFLPFCCSIFPLAPSSVLPPVSSACCCCTILCTFPSSESRGQTLDKGRIPTVKLMASRTLKTNSTYFWDRSLD